MHGVLTLLQWELTLTGLAYVMAAVPVGGVVALGRMSPLYRLPAADLCRWWSWCGFLIGLVFLGVKTGAKIAG